jgi:outer membrane biosynthesis protein TonB
LKPFWRNVFLIALAHIALIAGLVRWSVAARVSSKPESIVWLSGAGDLVSSGSKEEEQPPPRVTPPTEADDKEVEQERRVATTVKSEIELPSATPKPTATPVPKASATPTPKPKTTPKATPKPTPKEKLVAKASPKSLTKPKPSPAKAKSEKKEKIALVKKDSAPQSGSGQTGSIDKGASASGGSGISEFSWYGNMLHDRFYSAWIQPTTNLPSGTKISTLVKVRIEKDGRVSKFEIAKPSANIAVNESVRVVAKQVTQVDPPPTELIKADHYDVKINFELNTGEQ